MRRDRSGADPPDLGDFEGRLGAQLSTISGKSPLAGAMRYALTRSPRLRPCLGDGRLELADDAAERAMRGIALGRGNDVFLGAGGGAAAVACTRIETANLDGVDPQAWLADTRARGSGAKTTALDDLVPWNHPSAASPADWPNSCPAAP